MNKMFTFSALGEYGRLGNQMWQIAATLGTAVKHNRAWAFPKWEYADYFKVPEIFGSLNNPESITHKYHEPNFHYDEIPENAGIQFRKSNISYYVDLHGYFQSEKYWEHCRQLITATFSFSNDILFNCRKVVSSIYSLEGKKAPFTSIHFRFGDYVNNPYYFNLPDSDYYYDAICRAKLTEGQIFLVFSDNADLARAKMVELSGRFDEPLVYYIMSGQNEVHDLCLQSLCTTNIIANSSFSMWASILNSNVNKRVIAPKNWFAGDGLKNDTKDLYPKNTIIL